MGITQIIYDGQCPLCQDAVQRLQRQDTRKVLQYIDLHRVNVASVHPSLTKEACMAEMHALTPEGRVLRGFAAFRHIWGRLPSTAWAAPLLYIPGVSWAGNAVYRWVARRRYRVRQADCPTGSCAVHTTGG